MVVARLIFVKFKPEASVENAKKIWDESVIPAARTQKGFCGAFMLISELGNEGIAVSLWENKNDVETGEKNGYLQEQLNKFTPMFATPPSRILYNVNSKIILEKE